MFVDLNANLFACFGPFETEKYFTMEILFELAFQLYFSD